MVYPATLSSLTLNPAAVTGGASSTGTVTLNGAAPDGGTAVTLSSDNAAATVPASVTVPSGATSATFTVGTGAVTAATTANIVAAYGGVTQTAALTVNPAVTSSSPTGLTAAATGSNQVSLYWTGVSGATGYNVYRSLTSGGPYTLVNSGGPVVTIDTGPGMANTFQYTDVGLTSGTTYYYVATALVGTESVYSDEDSATPDASAIPWNSGNPDAIINAVNAAVGQSLQPNVDEDTEDAYPTAVGILTVSAPDGVIYQGNYADGSPAAAYPPSASYDSNSGLITYADGTAVSAPAESGIGTGAGASSSAQAVASAATFPISDLFLYTGNYTGIWRKIDSQPGALGVVGTAGLPDIANQSSSTTFIATHSYPPGYTDSSGNAKSGLYSDALDIYLGGHVNYVGAVATQIPVPDSHELDAGLQAAANLNNSQNATWVPGWVPIINPAGALVSASSRPAVPLTGLVVGNGSLKGYKIYAVYETRMQFLTPSVTGMDKLVTLNLNKPIGGIAGGDIRVVTVNRNPATQALSLGAPVSYNGATLVYFAKGWRKGATNDKTGNNIFSLKRSNSIAQSMLHSDTGQNPLLPSANGPSEPSPQAVSFLLDTSAVRGAYWGFAGAASGMLINYGGGWQSWTNINTQSLHSGAYPNSKAGGYGYVTWNEQNGFFWEDGINLKAGHTLP